MFWNIINRILSQVRDNDNAEEEQQEMPINMRMSQIGLENLAQFEGNVLHVYHDVAGYPTIGVGHLLTQDELSSGKILIDGNEVRYTDGITHEQSLALLSQDVAIFERAVNNIIDVDLEQHQFDALVSFSFNVGQRAFARSTLARRVNEGNFADVPNQFRRWIYAGGRVIQGLRNRREHEIEMWNGVGYPPN